MIVVVVGPPGAGKGTQAAQLAASTGMIHVSTGDVFREHLRRSTPLGEQARSAMEAGALVSDDLVVAMVRDTLQAEPDAGYVLDGFPRTLVQAEALDQMMVALDPRGAAGLVAVKLVVPLDEVTRRLTGRRVCVAEGHIYHLEARPPASPGRCDIDGSELRQRDDDVPETVARRLAVYARETGPVVAFYERSARLARVDGQGSRDDVQQRVLGAVRAAVGDSAVPGRAAG